MAWQIFTDGGARPNPGPGGWAAVMIEPETGGRRELSGGETETTNNRMELTAAIRALEALEPGAAAEIHTDSRYLRQGITAWLPRWIARGWRRADDGRVKNQDLWQRLADLDSQRQIRWHWLKGHAGHEHNERADQLAGEEIERLTSDAVTAPSGGGTAATADIEAWVKTTCRKGRGAWVVLLISDDEQRSIAGRGDDTSASRLELEAGLALFERTDPQRTVAVACGDYLRRGATEWLLGWKRNGWRTGAGEAVKNRDLWRRIDRALTGRVIIWRAAPKTGEIAAELRRRLQEALD